MGRPGSCPPRPAGDDAELAVVLGDVVIAYARVDGRVVVLPTPQVASRRPPRHGPGDLATFALLFADVLALADVDLLILVQGA